MPQSDLAGQFYSWREFGFAELGKGHLALWNPYIYSGAPFFAGFQSALLYPPNWLFMALPLVPTLNFSAALHIFLAGFFSYLWLSRSLAHFLPRLLGSFIFMFGGAFILHAYPGHLPNLCTMAWIPLVFLAVDRLLESPSLGRTLEGAAVLSMELLAGHVQYFVYTVFFAGIYGLAATAFDRRGWIHRLIGGLSMFLGCLALTAIQSLTGLEAVRDNLRTLYTPPEAKAYYSFPPLNLLTLLFPGLNGNMERFSCLHDTNLWWESSLFMGVCVLLLAPYGFSALASPKKWALAALALGSLLFALGFYTPFYGFLYGHLPILDSFRGSYKAGIFLQLALAAMAAKGLEEWLTQPNPASWPGWASGLLTLGLVVTAAAVFRSSGLKGFQDLSLFYGGPLVQTPTFLVPVQKAAVLAVNCSATAAVAGVFCLLWWTGLARDSWRPALALLALLDLWFFARSALPFFDPSFLERDRDVIAEKLGPLLEGRRVYWEGNGDLSLLSRTPDIWGDDPSLPKRYSRFIASTDSDPFPDRLTDVYWNAHKALLMRLAFVLRGNDADLRAVPVPGPTLPRTLLLGRWEFLPDQRRALAETLSPSFDPFHQVVLESVPDPLPEPGPGEGGWAQVKDVDTDTLEVLAHTTRPQILLVTDNYDDGWKAQACPGSVQEKYQVLPGDYIHRAVPLCAGNHHFYLKYDPPGYEAGKWISIFSLAAFLGLGGVAFSRKREAG